MYGRKVLVIEEKSDSGKLQRLLKEHGYELRVADSRKKAFEMWREQEADYVLLAGAGSGRGFIKELYKEESECLTDTAGNLWVDRKRHQVMLNNAEIRLTLTEYRLLVALMGAPGRIFTREQLILAVFEEAYTGYDRSIDTHIKELRHKLGETGRRPRYIHTVHGVGYKFVS